MHWLVFRPSFLRRAGQGDCIGVLTALQKGSFTRWRTLPVAVPRRRVWSLSRGTLRSASEAAQLGGLGVDSNGGCHRRFQRRIIVLHRIAGGRPGTAEMGPLSPHCGLIRREYPYTFKPLPDSTDCVGSSHSPSTPSGRTEASLTVGSDDFCSIAAASHKYVHQLGAVGFAVDQVTETSVPV